MVLKQWSEPRWCNQHAVALLSVLWVLVLLSLIALNISATSRLELKLAANLVEAAAVRQTTDAGINWALWSLLQTNTGDWLADGSQRTLELDDIAVQVAITDEHGKIDLNKGSPLLLQGLFLVAGVEQDEAVALTDAIQDWRDTDQLRRLYGAESEEYLAAGLPEPANRPFERIEELRKVLGMTPELYAQVKPALTIYSERSQINPLVAPRLVLLALPGVSEATVDQYIEERRRNYEQGQSPPAFTGINPELLASNVPGIGYSIDTAVTKANSVVSRQRMIIRRRGGIGSRFEILLITTLQVSPDGPLSPSDEGESL